MIRVAKNFLNSVTYFAFLLNGEHIKFQSSSKGFHLRHTPRSDHQRMRNRSHNIRLRATPEMQAVGMTVYVNRFRWMKLNDAIFIFPEQFLDLAHYGPRRGFLFVFVGDADVLPAHAVRDNTTNHVRVQGKPKHTVEPVRVSSDVLRRDNRRNCEATTMFIQKIPVTHYSVYSVP